MAALGPFLGSLCAVPGRSWSLCWRSWTALGPYFGSFGSLLGAMWLKNAKNMATLKMCFFLGRERDLRPLGWSEAALGPCVGGLGPLLGSMLSVLNRSWGLSSRSWGFCLRSGLDLEALVAVLGRLGAKSCPNPSGKAIWAGSWPPNRRPAPRTQVGDPNASQLQRTRNPFSGYR